MGMHGHDKTRIRVGLSKGMQKGEGGLRMISFTALESR